MASDGEEPRDSLKMMTRGKRKTCSTWRRIKVDEGKSVPVYVESATRERVQWF